MANTPAAKGAAKEVDPAKVKVARTLGRLLWERDFRKSNPEADAAAKKEAWEKSRADYMRAGRQMHARLEKAGLTITAPAE